MRTSSGPASTGWARSVRPTSPWPAPASWADAIGAGDDLQSLDAGVLAGFGGFSLGGKVFANTDVDEAEGAAAGLKFGFGAANVSVGYVFFDPDDGEETNLIAASAPTSV